MAKEQIRLDAYIPYYELYKTQAMYGGALQVFLRGDREVNTDAINVAIITNLQKLGLDPNERLLIEAKVRKGKFPRLSTVVEMAAHPHKFVWRPTLRFVIVRMPEAGFTLNFSRRVIQLWQRADWHIDDSFPIFVRKYLIKIEYAQALKGLAETNYQVRQWTLQQWKKIKDSSDKHFLREKYYEKTALTEQ